MRKYKLILVVFLVFSLPLFSESESGKIHYFEKVTGEYYDIFENVDDGVGVILNSKKIFLLFEKNNEYSTENLLLKTSIEISDSGFK